MTQYIIYSAVVGSRAYGLATDASDTDRRGCFLPPARLHWSLRGVPEQVGDDEAQECYWELGKMVRLALRANPNVLEVLHSPLVERSTQVGDELLAIRGRFLSRKVRDTYLGYADSQFRKLAASRDVRAQVNWKHAMHLIRLLIQVDQVLRTGELKVDVSDHRSSLLAIRQGEVSFEELDALRTELTVRVQSAYVRTSLPDEPDTEAVDAFLVRARRAMVDA